MIIQLFISIYLTKIWCYNGSCDFSRYYFSWNWNSCAWFIVFKIKNKVKLSTKKNKYVFDKVILASHSDQSLKIARNLPKAKRDMLTQGSRSDFTERLLRRKKATNYSAHFLPTTSVLYQILLLNYQLHYYPFLLLHCHLYYLH